MEWNDIETIKRLVRSLLKDRLNTTGRDSFQYHGDANFTLSEDYPSSATVKVYKNGTLLSTGYSYNSATNIVTITASLATNDIILITYSFYDKYSDAELVDYIECSLAYFAQFNYKKTFKLNDARTAVLTIDGVNPTAREVYEIAIITALNIDPENVEIKTKDFSVTAVNKMSKVDLIHDALTKFTFWVGEITFDESYFPDVY